MLDTNHEEDKFADPAANDTHDGVAVVEHGTIAEVVLNRPKVLNALDLAMWRRLADVFRGLAGRQHLRAIVIRGAGEKAFSAGADIAEFRERRVGLANATEYNASIADALVAIRDTPLPVVAMVRGLAVGGGCEIAAACDLRVAAETARLAIPIGSLGVTLGVAEATAVVALIGPSQTKRLILTGELISAEEALRIGLVDFVVSPGSLESKTWGILRTVASAAPTAARANKVVVNSLAYGPPLAFAETLKRLTTEVYEGAELQEGITAFLDKRQPVFDAVRDER